MTIQPTGEVHPAADIFPMLGDEELADLAADIAANGLLYPIVLDANGRLIDGRNRLRACQMVGVEPRFTSLNGHDPVAYILSANIQRRHLSKGQAAMATVAANAVSEKPLSAAAGDIGVSKSRVVYAVVVHEHAADLVSDVLAGLLGLNAAYDEARQRKQARESEAERGKRLSAEHDALRREAPDLADLVVSGTMTLPEAQAALEARKRQRALEQETTTRSLVELVQTLEILAGSADARGATLANYSPALALRRGAPVNAGRLRAVAAGLTQLAEGWTDETD